MSKSPLVRDEPFLSKSGLTDRWYFVASWRQVRPDFREAHVKHDVTDAIHAIIRDHGGTP